MRSRLWAVICALLYVLSFPPVSLWFLSIPAFGLFSWLLFEDIRLSSALNKRKGSLFREIFVIFFVFSFATRLGSLYWIPHTFIEFASFPLVIAWILGLFIYLLMSLPAAFVGALLVPKVWTIRQAHLRCLSVFVFWILWDYLDFRFFDWVPAQSLGGQKYLLATAGILGSHGWNFLFYGLISLLHFPLAKPLQKRVLAWGALWILVLLGAGCAGYLRIQDLKQRYSKTVKVALLQGSVGNFEKKMQNREESPTNENVLRIYRDMIESLALKQKYERLGDIFVFWPETAFPGFPLNDPSLSELLSSWARITRGYHLIGAYEEDSTLGIDQRLNQYNVVVAFDSNGKFQGHYRKVVRMPFGEYVPGDEYFPWIYVKFPFLNYFGKGLRPVPLPHDSKTGPVFLSFICFEVLKESYVKESVQLARSNYPDRDLVIVNPTNDSWFGEGAELFLHSHLARWQVAREGIPMVRPTNTGISMVVAPWGEVLTQGRVGIEEMILSEVPLTRSP